jgi:splicing factor 3A subunit 1
MSALNLPRPVNSYAGEDVLRSKMNGSAVNGNAKGATVADGGDEVEEDIGEYKPPRPSDRYKAGIIYPPKEIRCKSKCFEYCFAEILTQPTI